MRINLKRVFATFCILLWLSLICLGIISCGARNAHKEREKESSQVEVVDKSTSETKTDKKEHSESNVKKTEETIVNNQDKTVTKKVTLEPIDNTKPASYKGKDGTLHELNNSKKTTETTTKDNNTKTESKVNSEQSEKKSKDSVSSSKKNNNVEVKGKFEHKKENIDVTRGPIPVWYIIVGLLVLALILWALKKYTKIFG